MAPAPRSGVAGWRLGRNRPSGFVLVWMFARADLKLPDRPLRPVRVAAGVAQFPSHIMPRALMPGHPPLKALAPSSFCRAHLGVLGACCNDFATPSLCAC